MFRNRNRNANSGATSNGNTLTGHGHRTARIVLSSLLLASALILLGLTARRIHFTRGVQGGSSVERIVIELLITSILTIIISTLLILALVRTSAIGFIRKLIELGSLLLIWLMAFVGAAIASHHWANLKCGRFFALNQCHLVQAIKAFSWIVFVLTTILVILRLVNWRRDKDNAGSGSNNGQGKHTAGAVPTSNNDAVV